MATIRPFRALRPPADRVLSVQSPPYDVVSTAEARALAAGHPDSYLYVSRPEIALREGIDEHGDEVYAAGRRHLDGFRERGVLVQDGEPHLYLYAQRMGEHRQIGVVACASVAEYLDGRIRKHERTRADKEDDRTRHITELGAHDEPVFLSYRAHASIDREVARLCEAAPEYDFTSEDAVHHRLWVVPREESKALARLFAELVDRLYVADGHHRSAAAARAHRALATDGREHDVFLAVLFPHDQMQILPYNRLVRDRRGRTPAELITALGARLKLAPATEPAPREPGTFGLYVGGAWYHGMARERPPADDAVAGLDCQICQDQILAPVFGILDPRRDDAIAFVGGIHGAAPLARRVDAGEADVAIYLYPTTMEQVMRVSDADAIMPPKSTWFEPKLKSGLFVHVF